MRVRGEHLLKRVVGNKGSIRRITFEENFRTFDCLVPEQSLWGAVKDNLILSEYERCGIQLPDFNGTVVDAGAHVGLFSLRAAPYASSVIAIEPHPMMAKLLKLNLRTNAIQNVAVLQKALWGLEGEVILETRAYGVPSVATGMEAAGDWVETVTLEQLIDLSGPIALLKLDIEGAEFEVISRARSSALSNVQAIVAELHLRGREERVGEISRKLRSAGFLVTIRPPPIEFWRESVSCLLTNWRRLKHHTRLKAALGAAYTVAAIQRGMERNSGTTRQDLAFLFARRRVDGESTRVGRGVDVR